MTSLQGVTPAGPPCRCTGRPHRVDCLAVAAVQPHAMVNDDGEVFYPDGPQDAAWFTQHHGARPIGQRP